MKATSTLIIGGAALLQLGGFGRVQAVTCADSFSCAGDTTLKTDLTADCAADPCVNSDCCDFGERAGKLVGDRGRHGVPSPPLSPHLCLPFPHRGW